MKKSENQLEREALPPCPIGHDRRFLNLTTGLCEQCQKMNDQRGRQKPQAKSDWKPKHQHDAEYVPDRTDGRIDKEHFETFLRSVMDDPIRKAVFIAEGRRPGNVSRSAHGISMRKVSREPMLNGDPRRVKEALERPEKSRLPKLPAFKKIVVKPTNHVTGARGWYSRLWTIHQLRYSRGVVAVTDTGEETQVFPQYDMLRKAILKSGWNIIIEDVRQGGNRRG